MGISRTPEPTALCPKIEQIFSCMVALQRFGGLQLAHVSREANTRHDG